MYYLVVGVLAFVAPFVIGRTVGTSQRGCVAVGIVPAIVIVGGCVVAFIVLSLSSGDPDAWGGRAEDPDWRAAGEIAGLTVLFAAVSAISWQVGRWSRRRSQGPGAE
ncbi:MAG: hypothetical protein IT336_03535 [Thermomicrobiales bacterium]|nr:hypothetical protein [Thermomicrobiales bacterium]